MLQSRLPKALIVLLMFVFLISLIVLQSYLEVKRGLTLYPINLLILILMNINLLVMILFVFLIGRTLVKTYLGRKKGVPGASFRFKMMVSFLAVSLLPTLFLLVISIGFIEKSFSSWITKRMDTVVESTSSVSKALLDEKKDKMEFILRVFDRGLISEDVIKDIVKDGSIVGILVFNQNLDKILGYLAKKDVEKRIDIQGLVKDAFSSKGPIYFYSGKYYFYARPYFDRVVVIIDKLPKDVAQGLGYIESIQKEFLYFSLIKNHMKRSYIYTFILITVMVVFASLWFGLQVAKGVVEPIESLILATKQVSEGNFNVELSARGEGELNLLIDSFRKMAKSLGEKTKELVSRNVFIESVVGSVSSGIVYVDRDGRIGLLNKAILEILGIEGCVEDFIGKRYFEVFDREKYRLIYEIVGSFLKGKSRGRVLTQHVDVEVKGEVRNLIVTVTGVTLSNVIEGIILVVDDITEFTRLQRAIVWEEVARRLAHEIKNPLTPIKLSAQRLLRKYGDSVDDKETFKRTITTIIKAVDDMKRMVDEFYRFARMPEVRLEVTDLAEVVRDLVEFYRTSWKEIDFTLSVDDDFPKKVLVDGEQMRRAIMNIIENAIDALEGNGRIDVRLKFKKEDKILVIEIADTGKGIPDEDKEKIFIPYYSTKPDGVGLGLTITDKIIADHGGYIKVRDNHPSGTVFVIEIPYKEVWL